MNEKFFCYAYEGVPVMVTEKDCKNCEMGPKGCPAWNPDWRDEP